MPVSNPKETAMLLAYGLDVNVSVGYDVEFEYDKDKNAISEGDYRWEEILKIVVNPENETYKLEIPKECAKRIYASIPSIDNVEFSGEDTESFFIGDVLDKPFEVYVLDSGKRSSYLRIFEEIVDFDVQFSGRWQHYEQLFKNPYEGENKLQLDEFRRHIYRQMLVAGCDKAYYFPDQDFGMRLCGMLNKSSDEWLAYLESREYLDDDGEDYLIIEMRDYIEGKIVLGETDNLVCVADDFSDLK